MCTATTYITKDTYFGRNLDYEFSYGEDVVITPRGFRLALSNGTTFHTKYAIIGVAHVANDYPLYYDGINEKGLGIAGLNFVNNARYSAPIAGKENIAQYEFIPWLLGSCANISEVLATLKNLNITDTAFSAELPPAEQHWLISDPIQTIVLELTATGMHIYNNPSRTLTNNPPFDKQAFRLNDYAGLSAENPSNKFSNQLPLDEYSRGMGAIGLPGDLSSSSRFVRTVFTNLNSVSGDDEMSSVSQFFHILDAASQARGCCNLGHQSYEITIYTSCYNLQKGICYYNTYDNRQLNAVDMHKADLDAKELIRYPIIMEQNVNYLN